MRHLALGTTFDGSLAWDSFFHLTPADQRDMFAVFKRHAAKGTALMFTSGGSLGESIGSYHGEPLYHVSLSPEEYESLLDAVGFRVVAYVRKTPAAATTRSGWLRRADCWVTPPYFFFFAARFSTAAEFAFTAARISVLNAASLTVSPSRKSIARRVPPSMLELNSFFGSGSEPRAQT